MKWYEWLAKQASDPACRFSAIGNGPADFLRRHFWKAAADDRPLLPQRQQQSPYQVALPTTVRILQRGRLPQVTMPGYGQRTVWVREDLAPKAVKDMIESMSRLKTLEWKAQQLWQDLQRAPRYHPRTELLRQKRQQVLRELQQLRERLPAMQREAYRQAVLNPTLFAEWRDPVTPKEIARRLDWEERIAREFEKGQLPWSDREVYKVWDKVLSGYAWPTIEGIRHIAAGGSSSYEPPALMGAGKFIQLGPPVQHLSPIISLQRQSDFPSLRGIDPGTANRVFQDLRDVAKWGWIRSARNWFRQGRWASANDFAPPDFLVSPWKPPVIPKAQNIREGYAAHLLGRSARSLGYHYESARRDLPKIWRELKSLWAPNGRQDSR